MIWVSLIEIRLAIKSPLMQQRRLRSIMLGSSAQPLPQMKLGSKVFFDLCYFIFTIAATIKWSNRQKAFPSKLQTKTMYQFLSSLIIYPYLTLTVVWSFLCVLFRISVEKNVAKSKWNSQEYSWWNCISRTNYL